MEPAALLDEIAAAERQIRALQARQLRLVAQFAEAERGDGLAFGGEDTERAIGMEVAGALGVSVTSAMLLAGCPDTLTDQLPAVLAALAGGQLGLYAARQIA